VIATGLTGYASSPCTYTWNPIPTIDTTTAKVMVSVYDPGFLNATDTSTNNFAIDSTPAVAATNFRAELTGTQDVTLYWTASSSPDVSYYQIWYISNGWSSTAVGYAQLGGNIVSTSYVHTAVGNNSANEYCYQLRTFDQVGHETRTTYQAAKFSRTITITTATTGVSWGGWIMLGSSLVQSSYNIDFKLQGIGFGAGIPVVYNWSAIELYNAWDNADHWKMNVRNATASQKEITTINNTQAFWVCCYNGARYASAGYVSNLSIPLKAGWNMVPYPLAARAQTTATLLAHLQANCPGFGGTYSDMQIFNRLGSATYRLSTPTGTETLTHQEALWVFADADTIWTVANY